MENSKVRPHPSSTVHRLLAQRDDALHRLLALAGEDGEGLFSTTRNSRTSGRGEEHVSNTREPGCKTDQASTRSNHQLPSEDRSKAAAAAEIAPELSGREMTTLGSKVTENYHPYGRSLLESMSPEEKEDLLVFLMENMKQRFADELAGAPAVENKTPNDAADDQKAGDELITMNRGSKVGRPCDAEKQTENRQLTSPPMESALYQEQGDHSSDLVSSLQPILSESELPRDKQELVALITAITDGQNDTSSTMDKEADGAEQWHSPFTESIYTMLYICKFQSQAFWYGLFIHFLQIVTISLTLIDVVDFTGINGNPLRMPPMVDITVTCSQGVTLFLALAYQSDLIEAVLKLKDGFYPEVLPKYPGATYGTWLFSCLAQLLAGLLLLTSTFILTMQASDVLTIMLNFAALHFMADIDDLGFALAKLGFVTNKLQFETMEVLEFEVPKRKQTYMLRRILYYLTLLGIFLGYAWLKTLQLDGYYLQSVLYVQFGDGYNPKIPFYSGFLSSGTARTRGHRKYRDTETQEILLAYCIEEKAWTFSVVNDPCKYFAKSYKTRSYDVTSIPDPEWQILDSYNRLQPFQSFSLVGRDCDPDNCRGECVEQLCVCPKNHFGTDCEFTNVCPEVVVNGAFQPFPSVNINSISDEFHLLYNTGTGNSVRVYNMPVYYSNKTNPANIIFFGGRRWVLTDEDGLFNLTRARLENPLQKYFPKKTVEVFESGFFHGHFQANYTPLFLSDPVDFETPAFQPTPIGLGWSTVAFIDEDNRLFGPKTPVDTVLGCVSCLPQFGGYCDEEGGFCNQTTGLCDCRNGYEGSSCERQQPCYQMDFPCWGDGICDKNDGFCRCNLPWFGKLCDIHYHCYEEYGSCLNGGVCNHTSGLCDCPEDPALAGYACEKRKDCHIYGCENGGICDETTGICDCPFPYNGILCSLLNGTRAETSDCGINATDCSSQFESAAADFLPCKDDMDCGSASSCTFEVAENESGVCVPLNVTNCHDKGCSKRGFCNAGGHCECPFPYTGRSCDYYVVEL